MGMIARQDNTCSRISRKCQTRPVRSRKFWAARWAVLYAQRETLFCHEGLSLGMKLISLLVSSLCVAVAQSVAAQTQADVFAAKAEVGFHEPERYTDIGDGSPGRSDTDNDHLIAIRGHLEYQVARMLPAGSRLIVTFTDIDLAGDFEPWRGSDFKNIRVVKDIYPPRLDLNYRLIDARGEVVREGQVKLGDMTFMSTLPKLIQDPLRYEKELLDNWIRSLVVSVQST